MGVLAQDHNIASSISNLDKLKDSATPASRLYNWNLLADAMKKLGMSLDTDIKSLIVAGDFDMINELLKDIHDSETHRLDKMSLASSK